MTILGLTNTLVEVDRQQDTTAANRHQLSEAQEDYLKAILLLADGDDARVGTHQLAERLAVTPASVTGMVQRLAQLRFVSHRPYRGVRLTGAGRRVALEIVRRHRLLETFLVQILGYRWDEVHGEAERLEHVISETFEERMATLLGDPVRDPHGDPIPRRDFSLPSLEGERPLSALEIGEGGRLTRVVVQDAETLAMLSGFGLELGVRVTVVERSLAGVWITVAGGRLVVPAELAEALLLIEGEDE